MQWHLSWREIDQWTDEQLNLMLNQHMEQLEREEIERGEADERAADKQRGVHKMKLSAATAMANRIVINA